ncbi:hypothetical protein JCM10207_007342 [Rhodosporidiobolus poonsookiae]
MASSPPRQYLYPSEIQQMVYVFTGLRDPSDLVVQYLEDATRQTMVDLATRRGSRALAVEDLVFLVRHDRAKVNRLRSYLSWKDVRKKRVTEPEAEEELEMDGAAEDDKSLKVLKTTVRLPWELADTWADYLRGEDDPEDDEAEAFQVNKKRLREADEITRNMSKEEYEQYAQARQASFVYRKGKKFRDFLLLSTLFDSPTLPNDEVLDVLGFLSYECVRALCDAGLTTRRGIEAARAAEERREKAEKKRRREAGEDEEQGDERMDGASPAGAAKEGASPAKDGASPKKPRRTLTGDGSTPAPGPTSPSSKPLEIPTSLFSAPLPESAAAGAASSMSTTPALPAISTFGAAPVAATAAAAGESGAAAISAPAPPLLVLDIDDLAQGLQAVEHSHRSLKTHGMRNWRGGVTRLSGRLV